MTEQVRNRRATDRPPPAEPGAAGAGAGESQGHARALSELFESHNRALVSFLMARLGNEGDAREVAQEAYVRMLQLERPGAVSFLRAYLFKTAANLALDRIRRRVCSARLEETYCEDDLTNTVDPDREVCAREQLAIVRQALMEVPERYRRAFLLNRFDDMSTEEIGRELGIKETQTRKYLRRVTTYCRLRMDGLTELEAKEQFFS
jgi:RNA polymerase sigma factor (sigma-70 family)